MKFLIKNSLSLPVISASRRCDLPRFHWSWLKNSLQSGTATVKLPRGGIRTVNLLPEEVHSVVFWSKDYSPILKDPESTKLLAPYNLFFHFTITGLGGSFLEPGVPSTEKSLAQAKEIAERYGGNRIVWRFDPIIFWRQNASLKSNSAFFPAISEQISASGITRCVFSFTQYYSKVSRRLKRSNIEFVDPENELRSSTLSEVQAVARESSLNVYSCAPSESDLSLHYEGSSTAASNPILSQFLEKLGKDAAAPNPLNELFPGFPGNRELGFVVFGNTRVLTARCIDGELLSELHPHKLSASLKKDRNQRQSCGCTESIDIGSYSMPCPADSRCLYCYAAP